MLLDPSFGPSPNNEGSKKKFGIQLPFPRLPFSLARLRRLPAARRPTVGWAGWLLAQRGLKDQDMLPIIYPQVMII